MWNIVLDFIPVNKSKYDVNLYNFIIILSAGLTRFWN